MANLNIFESVNPEALAAYITGMDTSQNYTGETFFPTVYVPGMKISYLKDTTRLSVALRPSALDAEPTLRGRRGFEQITEELPFFREAFFIGEKEYKELLTIYRGDMASRYATEIIRRFYNDGTELYNGALMQLEAMRMQLLSKGGIIELQNGNIKYDFKMPAENKFAVTPGAEWNLTAAADIIGDIRRWREAMQEGPGGTPPSILMMSQKTWSYIADNEKINRGFWAERGINVTSGSGPSISDEDYKRYIKRKLSTGASDSGAVEFVIISKKYRPYENSVPMPFFEDDKVALLPLSTLGNTYYTDTPESDFNASGVNTDKFKVTTMKNGITISQSMPDRPPLSIETWVSMIALPSFQAIDQCGLATVA
jgi:hypothetical protein